MIPIFGSKILSVEGECLLHFTHNTTIQKYVAKLGQVLEVGSVNSLKAIRISHKLKI